MRVRKVIFVSAVVLTAVFVAVTAWVDGGFWVAAMLAFVVTVFTAPAWMVRYGDGGGEGPLVGDGGGGDGG